MRRRGGLVLAGLLLITAAPAARAKLAYPKALSEYFGPLLSRRLAECGTCHAEAGSGEAKFNTTLERPHNAFGARLMEVGKRLAKAGRPPEIAARLDAVAGEDSDGDGVPNAVELLAGHRPGSRKDRPPAARAAQARKMLPALAKRRSAYAWRPFEPVRRPAVPPRGAWGRNPIDAFLAAGHRERGLAPRPEAPKHVLLRRVYLDLVGLPPTPEELAAFLADRSPDAYERVVDRLLASTQHGERWARHWMDVWRYSDWDGYGAEIRNSQPHIWRWRDWIVNSLNADRGYDRMVQEMLAGDELAPGDPQVLPATGFLVRNWYKFSRHETLNRIVEGTSKAFLGLTLNCARCHDHKYDPVPMKEFYSFRAIFEPHDIRLDRVPGQLDPAKDGLARVFDANPAAQTLLHLAGDDRKPDPNQPCAPAVPAFLGGRLEIRPVALPLEARIPDKQAHVIETQRREAARRTEQAKKAAAAARTPEDGSLARLRLEAAEAAEAALEATLAVEKVEDAGGREEASPRHAEWRQAALRADAAQRREAAAEAEAARAEAARSAAALEAAVPAKPAELQKAREALAAAERKRSEAAARLASPPSTAYRQRFTVVHPAESTGRRLALARWITDERNPLAARVAVNHIWLRHFNAPLAASVFDFGGNGQAPSHPALLDWLASELMGGKWSMKRIHRLIVTSGAYRMDSTHDAGNAARDPDNVYLWRMNPRRMEAETVRDSVLLASGGLDTTMGGPELDQGLGLTANRRSLYFRHSVEKQVEFLATFDQASVNECYRRVETVVPQQALALANSSLVQARSRVLAADLWKAVSARPSPAAARDFIAAAFLQVLGRAPTREEQAECTRFLATQAALLAAREKLTPFGAGAAAAVPPSSDPSQRARESLVHVLFNHNEFVTIR